MYAQYQKCAFVVGSIQLAPYNGLAKFPAPTSGSIILIQIGVMAGGTLNALGDAIFDMRVNGVTQFASDADRPRIVASASIGGAGFARGDVYVNELEDEISIDLKSVPAGGIGGPMWIVVTIDHSVTAGRWVTDLYTGALARDPTGPELADGIADLEAGMTSPKGVRDAASALALEVLNGAEYIARARTNAQFVEDCYNAVLGRDSGGAFFIDFYVALLVGGMTRATMIGAFSGSTESTNNRLNEVYTGSLPYGDAQYILGIPVDSTGLVNGNFLKYSTTGGAHFEFAAAGGGGLALARSNIIYDTANLVNGADEVGTIVGGKVGQLLRVQADGACRVRIYRTSAERTTDRPRVLGATRNPRDGMMAEFVFSGALLDIPCQDPVPTYYNLDNPAVSDIYITVQNTSGATRITRVTFTVLKLEV